MKKHSSDNINSLLQQINDFDVNFTISDYGEILFRNTIQNLIYANSSIEKQELKLIIKNIFEKALESAFHELDTDNP